MSIINANPEKMRNFADYVGEFEKNIIKECDYLEAATNKLRTSMSEEEMRTIFTMVSKIETIVYTESETFRKLGGAINIYADYIAKAKRIANGG